MNFLHPSNNNYITIFKENHSESKFELQINFTQHCSRRKYFVRLDVLPEVCSHL